MSKYLITGKRSLHFTLNDKGVLTECSLHEGIATELPDENGFVKTLLAKKMIEKVEETKSVFTAPKQETKKEIKTTI